MRLISRVASSEWPPERKEIVVDADPLDPEHLGEQAAQNLLLRRARLTPPSPRLRRRQRRAVELAVRRQRQAIQQ